MFTTISTAPSDDPAWRLTSCVHPEHWHHHSHQRRSVFPPFPSRGNRQKNPYRKAHRSPTRRDQVERREPAVAQTHVGSEHLHHQGMFTKNVSPTHAPDVPWRLPASILGGSGRAETREKTLRFDHHHTSERLRQYWQMAAHPRSTGIASSG